MQNWNNEWKGVKQVQGLRDDEKSDTFSACEINDFFTHKAAEKDNLERSPLRGLSALSALSSLSPDFRGRSNSLISHRSSISDKSNASLSLRMQTFSDLMPTEEWAPPHYKDYEEEPYDPYKLSRSPKTNRSCK